MQPQRLDVAGQPPRGGQDGHLAGLLLRFGTQAMVQRGHLHAKPESLGDVRGSHQEGRGVRAAGNGEQHRTSLESQPGVRLLKRRRQQLRGGIVTGHRTAVEWSVG